MNQKQDIHTDSHDGKERVSRNPHIHYHLFIKDTASWKPALDELCV